MQTKTITRETKQKLEKRRAMKKQFWSVSLKTL